MAKVHYRNEKDLIIEQLWTIVFRTIGSIDDAGCDWLTIGNITCIANSEWVVSHDPEIARLVNAINALSGNPEFIYASLSTYNAAHGEQVEPEPEPCCFACGETNKHKLHECEICHRTVCVEHAKLADEVNWICYPGC